MLSVIIICSIISILTGLGIKLFFDAAGEEYSKINRFEMVVGSILCAVVVIPLVTWGGFSIVRGSKTSYNEFYSGLETKAYEEVTTCRRDGSCKHTYDCDRYTVTHVRTDSDGKTHVETETKYHSCPYTKTEHSFFVKDTLGETYTIGDHWFPENPSQHRYRDKGFPDGIPKGKPAQWVAAKARIESGNPGGTTKRAKYKNFIQASADDIYEKYSNAIKSYRNDGVLPKVTTRVYGHYLADKVYLPTGVPVGDSGGYQEALMRLNGRIGGERHGDLHLVAVDASRVPGADEYTAALEAYWQSKDLGKNTISKNAIVVVVGYSGGTVTWSRGFTGMPVGNESLIVKLREDLTGTSVASGDLIPAIGEIIFAPTPNGFERVPMDSYKYLFDSIQPSGWQKFWITLVAFILSLGVWAAFLAVEIYSPISFKKES